MFSIDAKTKGWAKVDSSRDMLLRHEHCVGASWMGRRGDEFSALGCTFERCDFRKMRLSQMTFASGMEPTKYIECKFDGSRLKHVGSVGEARFERCSFVDVDINKLISHAGEFIDCVFSGVLRHSFFYGRVFESQRHVQRTTNEFRGNDFSNMTFLDVDFRHGIDLSLQRLPAGDNYLFLRNAEEKLRGLRQRYLQQPPSPRRQEIFRFLEGLEQEVHEGQRDLFLCKDSEPLLSRETLDAIWQELSDET